MSPEEWRRWLGAWIGHELSEMSRRDTPRLHTPQTRHLARPGFGSLQDRADWGRFGAEHKFPERIWPKRSDGKATQLSKQSGLLGVLAGVYCRVGAMMSGSALLVWHTQLVST